MGLKSATENFTFVVQPLPEHGATARLAANQVPVGTVIERPPVDLNEVAGRFLADLGRGTPPSAADWNKIAWCLWTTEPAIARHDNALDTLLDRVVQTVRNERRKPYRQLASAYLADFAADRPKLKQISGVLRNYAPAAGTPWDRLQAKYAVFDGAEAALRLARLALKEKAGIQNVFEAVGVSGPLLAGEFVRAAHDEGLKIIAKGAVTNAAEHVGMVKSWSLRSDQSLIFQNSKAEIARAVVNPFGDRIPPPSDRDLVLNFIVSQFGDPRVNSSKWIGMDDVARVLRRWLTEQSLRQFLDVVEKTAPEQFKYRRAFWEAYHNHKKEPMQNAWVILGEEGAAYARQAFGQDVPFGRFRGGSRQIEPGHAVLLLDFGECIVADWSHNGRCNIWRKSDRTRPQLNALYYTSDEIMRRVPRDRTEANLNRHDIFTHVGAATYVWQNRVASRLYDLISVRVDESDYQVP